jgi:GAF domain-containing protein
MTAARRAHARDKVNQGEGSSPSAAGGAPCRAALLRHPRYAARRDFDDIVHLAATICGTPNSVVNLIDAGRQWFKAETGLGVRETPLDTSICSHAILERDFVEIEDTRADDRMADNELCADEPCVSMPARS